MLNGGKTLSHGLASRVGLPQRALGTVLRTHDDLPARARFAHASTFRRKRGRHGRGRRSNFTGLNTSLAMTRCSPINTRKPGSISVASATSTPTISMNSVKATVGSQTILPFTARRVSLITASIYGASPRPTRPPATRPGEVRRGLGNLDGSVVPCAAGGSLPFLYPDCMQVLRTMKERYPKAWGRYGSHRCLQPADQLV
jgi:hypothetical protein